MGTPLRSFNTSVNSTKDASSQQVSTERFIKFQGVGNVPERMRTHQSTGPSKDSRPVKSILHKPSFSSLSSTKHPEVQPRPTNNDKPISKGNQDRKHRLIRINQIELTRPTPPQKKHTVQFSTFGTVFLSIREEDRTQSFKLDHLTHYYNCKLDLDRKPGPITCRTRWTAPPEQTTSATSLASTLVTPLRQRTKTSTAQARPTPSSASTPRINSSSNPKTQASLTPVESSSSPTTSVFFFGAKKQKDRQRKCT